MARDPFLDKITSMSYGKLSLKVSVTLSAGWLENESSVL